ncbi:MAG: hypothetical protein AAF721_21755 [Myxococcota bacterium]
MTALPLLLPAACDEDSRLASGQSVTSEWSQECGDVGMLDNLIALCNIIPGASCPDGEDDSLCRDYTRQLFVGAELGTPDGGASWNGRGGSGRQMSEALLCTMRELSPQLGGPTMSSAEVPVGFGTVRAVQEVGFTAFDREARSFDGYRRLSFDLPILGHVDVAAQDIHLEEVRVEPDTPSFANGYPIEAVYGVNVQTQERWRDLHVETPAFSVLTPIGEVSVTPRFDYATTANVIDSPYGSSTSAVVPNWLGSGETMVFGDLYGVDAGLEHTEEFVGDVDWAQFDNLGWLSGLALGSRNPNANDMAAWTGTTPRPDLEPFVPRSAEEAEPTVWVSAGADIRVPENPLDLLPDWVAGWNGVTLDAWIDIMPRITAGASGQLSFLSGEATALEPNGEEFGFVANRYQGLALQTATEIGAGFDVVIRVRMLVTFDTFFGQISLVDVDREIPFPADLFAAAQGDAHTTFASAEGLDAELDALTTFHSSHIGDAATSDFLAECFAPEGQPIPLLPPSGTDEPGDPESMIPDTMAFPCNICVAVDDGTYEGPEGTLEVFAESAIVVPADEEPTWSCNEGFKTGCMDLCTFDASTGSLTVTVSAPDLGDVAGLIGEDPTFWYNCAE